MNLRKKKTIWVKKGLRKYSLFFVCHNQWEKMCSTQEDSSVTDHEIDIVADYDHDYVGVIGMNIVRNRRNQSEVWRFFRRQANGLAKCVVCHAEYVQQQGTTSNLHKHLRVKHQINLSKERNEQGKENRPEKEVTTSSVLVNQYLIDMICENYLSFNLVDNDKFIKFCKFLNPKVTLPSRRMLSDSILAKRFLHLVKIVKSKLISAHFICLTTDTWTSIQNKQYLGLTAHFVDNDFKFVSVFLRAAQIDDSRAETVANKINETMQDFNITDKVKFLVTDNAANMKATANLLDLSWQGCVAHKINLIVKSLLDKSYLKEVLMKVKSIVGFFHHSTKANALLSKYQLASNTPQHVLKIECPTRWNSLYSMIDRFLEQLTPIKIALTELQSEHQIPNDEEINLLKFLKTALAPLKLLTDKFSEEKNVSCSAVIYLMHWAMGRLQSIKGKTSNLLGKKLIDDVFVALRATDLAAPASVKHYLIATFIDPRYKSHAFSDGRGNSGHFNTARDLVKREAYALSGNSQLLDSSFGEISFCESENVFTELERRKNDEYSRRNENESNVISELSSYAEEKAIPITFDALEYWKQRQYSFPILTLVAKKYLCLLSNSVPCERLFSKIGLIISDRRSRLKPKRVNQICFVKCNGFLDK